MSTWYVNTTGSGNYITMTELQTASQNGSLKNGDTVLFAAGTYSDTITIWQHVKIKSLSSGHRNVIFDFTSGPNFTFMNGAQIEGGSAMIFKNGNGKALVFDYSLGGVSGRSSLVKKYQSSVKNIIFQGGGSSTYAIYIKSDERREVGSSMTASFCTFWNMRYGIATELAGNYRIGSAGNIFYNVNVPFANIKNSSGVRAKKVYFSSAYSCFYGYNKTQIEQADYVYVIQNPDGTISNHPVWVAMSSDTNIFTDPKFISAGTNFKLTPFISPCINVYPRGGHWRYEEGGSLREDDLDLGAYGGLLGYDYEYGGYTEDFELRMLAGTGSNYENFNKTTVEKGDTPGRDYGYHSPSEGLVKRTGDKATGPYVIGETQDLDRFTPAYTNNDSFRIRVTMDDPKWKEFVDTGGTLTPQFGFYGDSTIDYKIRNSEIVGSDLEDQPGDGSARTLVSSGGEGLTWHGWRDFKSSGNSITVLESTATNEVYGDKLYLVSDTINELDDSPVISISQGMWIIYVRIKYDDGAGNTGYLRSFLIYKYSNETISVSIAESKTYPSGDIPMGTKRDYVISRDSGSLLPIEKVVLYPEFYQNGSWLHQGTDYQEIIMSVGEELPITRSVGFPKPNHRYRVYAKARLINGNWATATPTASLYTLLPNPGTPTINISVDFDPTGGSGSFLMTDTKDYTSFYLYPGDVTTYVHFRLYQKNQSTGSYDLVDEYNVQPLSANTGSGKGYNDDRKHLVWKKNNTLDRNLLDAGDYKWGIEYTNLNGTDTEEKIVDYSKPGTKTLAWLPDKLSAKNFLHIPREFSDRKRISVNLGEVDVVEREFNKESVFYSVRKTFPKPIYKGALSVSEEVNDSLTGEVLGQIDYYLSFDNGITWTPVNPMERSEEPEVSNIITINSGLTPEQKRLSGRPENSYVEMEYDPTDVIMKAVFKRGDNPNLTPKLYSYGIKIISRDVLRRQP